MSASAKKDKKPIYNFIAVTTVDVKLDFMIIGFVQVLKRPYV